MFFDIYMQIINHNSLILKRLNYLRRVYHCFIQRWVDICSCSTKWYTGMNYVDTWVFAIKYVMLARIYDEYSISNNLCNIL